MNPPDLPQGHPRKSTKRGSGPLSCKPDSVPWEPVPRGDDHFSNPLLPRDFPLARNATNTRRYNGRAAHSPVLSCTTRGLPCRAGYPDTRWALTPPFHPYLIPRGPSAVYSLLHFPSGRFETTVPRFHEARCPAVSGLSSTPQAEPRSTGERRGKPAAGSAGLGSAKFRYPGQSASQPIHRLSATNQAIIRIPTATFMPIPATVPTTDPTPE